MFRVSRILFFALALLASPHIARATETADPGDTAWILMSSALVLVMLPGLALFYGGMVRS